MKLRLLKNLALPTLLSATLFACAPSEKERFLITVSPADNNSIKLTQRAVVYGVKERTGIMEQIDLITVTSKGVNAKNLEVNNTTYITGQHKIFLEDLVGPDEGKNATIEGLSRSYAYLSQGGESSKFRVLIIAKGDELATNGAKLRDVSHQIERYKTRLNHVCILIDQPLTVREKVAQSMVAFRDRLIVQTPTKENLRTCLVKGGK